MALSKFAKVYTPQQISNIVINGPAVGVPAPSGTGTAYYPARAISFQYGWLFALPERLYSAWLAFTGQVDLVRWDAGQ